MNRSDSSSGAVGSLEFSKDQRDLVRQALLIRRVEEKLLDLFAEGKLNGTLHTCIGQEWSAVTVCAALTSDDCVFSNHRGHGHFLARTGDVEGLIAEIMGKQSGVCGGVGGSQHLRAPGFFSNGILGGMVPIAAGAAYAAKLRGSAISVVFVGDGALGEGIVYETLNLCAKWDVPLLIVVERNGIAQSTDCETTFAGTIEARAKAFGVEFRQASTWDWKHLLGIAYETVDAVRKTSRPAILEITTFRLKAHSKGDDTRPPEYVSRYVAKDPLNRLLAEGGDIATLDEEVHLRIARAVESASAAESCKFSVSATIPRNSDWVTARPEQKRVSDAIHHALHSWLENDGSILIGEDVEGPYGGAFKITRDLSLRFPGRVRNTPISEAAITGFATGMALRGMRPMVEIMFGDFTTLIFDQLIQHACKFKSMYGEKVNVPLVVRTPMGGRRGYGPTHSQSIEKHFIGIPNLTVVAVNHRLPIGAVYRAALEQSNPVLIIENKVLYTRTIDAQAPTGLNWEIGDDDFPWVRLSLIGRTSDLTIFCYGGMLEEAEAAMIALFEEYEIRAEILCPSRLAPFDESPLAESVMRTGRLLTCEEGSGFAALSSEAISRLTRRGVHAKSVRSLSYDGVIPSAYEAERKLLPGASNIIAAAKEMLR